MLSSNIKEATKTAHQQLEKIVIKKLKNIRSHADYADFLKHFYSYFNIIEKAIAPYITTDLLPDYDERRNSSYIKRDIEELGFDVNELPFAAAPQISSGPEALGALYVLEGSIMGGSIIVQMLKKNGITKGVSFFSGYGQATGQMWGTFTGVLDAAAKTDQEELAAINTANKTFENFGEVFNVIKA